MKRRVPLGMLGMAMLLCPTGCADHSFAVLSLTSYDGTLDGVAQMRVHVLRGSTEEVLLYPAEGAANLRLEVDRAVTLSVELSAANLGATSFQVEALAASGGVVGYGKAGATIGKNQVVTVPLRVVAGAVRPEHESADDQALTCEAADPAAACGAGRTCGVLCASASPAASLCYAAGAGNPGAACASNNDCSPGTQCFTFTADGCSVKTCLRFCTGDASCGEANAYCNVPVACGSSPAFHACSRPCDPSATGNGGCATGLACFVYSGDSTDCACPGLGTTGAPCTQNAGCSGALGCAGCAAGLSCVIPTGGDAGVSAGVCRPVCKLASPACPSGTTCHAFQSSSLYGSCQ